MITLRPQDLVILLGIVARADAPFGAFSDLALQTGISTGEVHKSLARTDSAGLYRAATRTVQREALLEFLTHGIQYAFPVVRGRIVRGVPTGVAAPPLADAFDGASLTPELTPVWPSPAGTRRGYTVDPLYRTVPEAAGRNAALYELLALTDARREGRARERSEALSALTKRLTGWG